MDHLVNDILSGLLGGRRKKSGNALRFITRGIPRGVTRGVMRNPSALLGIAGVAWGIFETLQNQNQPGQAAGGQVTGGGGLHAGNAVGTGAVGANSDANSGASTGAATGASAGVPPLPPLPGGVAAPAAAARPDADTLRLVRLAVSAANADGAMNEKERSALVGQLTAAGAAALLEPELAQPRPLPEIIAGVDDRADKATLYVLAFTILRADEQINGAERIYLAQLANLLGLDPGLVATLEKDTGERIDALGDQGQLGG
jgi:uncharacterized membrane protein YebE (DUF533 family)